MKTDVLPNPKLPRISGSGRSWWRIPFSWMDSPAWRLLSLETHPRCEVWRLNNINMSEVQHQLWLRTRYWAWSRNLLEYNDPCRYCMTHPWRHDRVPPNNAYEIVHLKEWEDELKNFNSSWHAYKIWYICEFWELISTNKSTSFWALRCPSGCSNMAEINIITEAEVVLDPEFGIIFPTL